MHGGDCGHGGARCCELPRAPLLHKLRCLWSSSHWRLIMRLASITTALLIAGIAPLLAEDGHPDVLKGPNDAKWGAAPLAR